MQSGEVALRAVFHRARVGSQALHGANGGVKQELPMEIVWATLRNARTIFNFEPPKGTKVLSTGTLNKHPAPRRST